MEKKKLLKVGGIYFISSIATNLINILLIPLYTRNLASAEYGRYNIVSSIQGLLSIFITRIYSGMYRFIYEYEDKNRIKNITFTFSNVWGVHHRNIIFYPICINQDLVLTQLLGKP